MVKTRQFSILKKWLPALLCLIVALGCFLPAAVHAQERTVQTVKVGWYQSDCFQEGTSDAEKKSGYCYEYLQKVADYIDLQYEYVYGGWSELFAMLENGQIDLLAGVSLTEERKQTMLFPDQAMGTDVYCLYKRANNTSVVPGDNATINCKRIGGIYNNRMTVLAVEWAEANDLDVEVVYFDSFEEMDAAFAGGNVDLITGTQNNVLQLDNISIVAKVGEEPYYLAVSKQRADLLSLLNQALSTLQEMDPFLLQNLQYANYGTTVGNRTLTGGEEEWIRSHDTLRVGYLENYAPFCIGSDSTDVTGILPDVLAQCWTELGLSGRIRIEYHSFSGSDALEQALRDGSVDAIMPITRDLWYLEQHQIDSTSAVITCNENLFYDGRKDPDQIRAIAVNENNTMQILFAETHFPEAELIVCPDMQACLEAVLKGTADGTIVNGYRTAMVTGNSSYKKLSYVPVAGETARCFGVAESNSSLLLLLNRGLKIVGADYGAGIANQYISEFYSYTAMDFVKDNILWIALSILLFLAAIIGTLLRSVSGHKKHAAELRAANAEQEARLEEIRSLNTQLEENQSQLEELSAEQESQIEEITALNEELETAGLAANAANDAKTSFLFNMSHDIRTPMNAIMGFRDLLEKHQEDPERRADYLKKIEDASTVLLSIINNVLEMARIEKGTIEIDESAWSAEQFNDTLYSVFQEIMTQKGITFTRHVNVQHPYVSCDPIKLREIFFNILSNACKYTNPGGRVTMDLVEIPSDREGYAMYQTTITDTGIGMSAEFLPHIFEEFSRENTSTENKIEGTGLGMPIVKRLVELMEGTIEVRSEKGVGTTFVVTIPHRITEQASLAQHAGVEIDPKLFAGKKILLAEDNDLNAEIAQEILGEAGFVVERAEDGVICCEKLSAAADNYFDLILMDIQMPHRNGYEATRTIRRMSDTAKARIPILAMTANAFEEDKREALRSGMNGHLAKPINVTELMKALAGILG